MFEIRNILDTILDTVLPRRERRTRIETRSLDEIPLSPASHELLGVRILTLMEYREPATKDLIRSLKYDCSGHAVGLCAALLADYLREEFASVRAFSKKHILLVPVPLHKNRLRERGFNQIEAVLRTLPIEFQDGALSHTETEALVRTRDTAPHTKLPRVERLTNVSGAFAANDLVIRDSHIYLIDDVVTTGATLVEAAKPLIENDALVTLMALARA